MDDGWMTCMKDKDQDDLEVPRRPEGKSARWGDSEEKARQTWGSTRSAPGTPDLQGGLMQGQRSLGRCTPHLGCGRRSRGSIK